MKATFQEVVCKLPECNRNTHDAGIVRVVLSIHYWIEAHVVFMRASFGLGFQLESGDI